jgi:hypothetical protein
MLWFWLLVSVPFITQGGIWRDLGSDHEHMARGVETKQVYYRALQADRAALGILLNQAPMETGAIQATGVILELPLPYGQRQRFVVEESPVMAPSLAARYPKIRTYRVKGIDEPLSSGRLDLTPLGFHAMLHTPQGVLFIDPDEAGNYRSYYKRDYARYRQEKTVHHVCHTPLTSNPTEDIVGSERNQAQRTLSGHQRRIYRLAVAATGEYTAYFGGQVELALAQIVTAINRVNQIYGRDLAIQFQLVGNNDRIIYTDPKSDPYTHTSEGINTMLTENNRTLDYTLGSNQYDIGHLFGTQGGGVASLGSACTKNKAQGYTGTPQPETDAFYIDFVAHELGHQFNANHTFNGTTSNCAGANRVAESAMEPGSGSTIMGYAGICNEENIQIESDATFHAISIQEIREFITNGSGQQCGRAVQTQNHPPLVDAGVMGQDGVYTLPISTPFRLTGQASDEDSDSLSYQWDEMDAGGEGGATDASSIGTDIPGQPNPLFRSYLPKTTPERYFPRLTTLITGQYEIGETLPETARALNFRLTVRDGASGVSNDDLKLVVDDTLGRFEVTGGSLNNGGQFIGGSQQSLLWSVAGTDTICQEVAISLLSLSSENPPVTYCDVQDANMEALHLGVYPNIGTAQVTLPDVALSRGRVMLHCVNGLFFNLTDNPLQIEGERLLASDCKPMDGEPLEHGTIFIDADSAEKFESPGGGGVFWIFNLLLVLALPNAVRQLKGA